jgi:hypothetical protein
MKISMAIIILAAIFTAGTVYAQTGAEYTGALSLSNMLANKMGQKISNAQDNAMAKFEVDPNDKPALSAPTAPSERAPSAVNSNP